MKVIAVMTLEQLNHWVQLQFELAKDYNRLLIIDEYTVKESGEASMVGCWSKALPTKAARLSITSGSITAGG